MFPACVLLVASSKRIPGNATSQILALVGGVRVPALPDIAVRITVSDPVMPAAKLRDQVVQPPLEFHLVAPELYVPADAHGPARHRAQAGRNVTVDPAALRPAVSAGQIGEVSAVSLAPHPQVQPAAAFGPLGSNRLQRGEGSHVGRRAETIDRVSIEPAPANRGDVAPIEAVIVAELGHERPHAPRVVMPTVHIRHHDQNRRALDESSLGSLLMRPGGRFIRSPSAPANPLWVTGRRHLDHQLQAIESRRR